MESSPSDGVRAAFPEGMVERGSELLVYYGATDVNVGVARVNSAALRKRQIWTALIQPQYLEIASV